MNRFIIGTAIKIESLISIDTPDAVYITIKDASDTDKVTEQTMEKIADGVYRYVHQTQEIIDIAGTWVARVYARVGNNIGVREERFEMIIELEKDYGEGYY